MENFPGGLVRNVQILTNGFKPIDSCVYCLRWIAIDLYRQTRIMVLSPILDKSKNSGGGCVDGLLRRLLQLPILVPSLRVRMPLTIIIVTALYTQWGDNNFFFIIIIHAYTCCSCMPFVLYYYITRIQL